MPSTFKWERDGLARLDALFHDTQERIVKDIVEDAKRLAPVDTGALRRSIDYVFHDDTALIVADVEYAAHVEMGTRFMAAQPFLRPALYKARGA